MFNLANTKSEIEQAIDRNELALALQLGKQLVQARPLDSSSNYWMAQAMVANSQIRAAIPFAERACKLAPNDADAHYLFGRLMLDCKLLGTAKQVLTRAQMLAPQSGVIEWALADLYLEILDARKAKSHFQKALTLMAADPNFKRLRFEYAQCLAASGEVREADIIFKELFEDPELSDQALEARALLRIHSLDSEVGRRVEARLVNAAIGTKLRTNLLLALGNMHDATKNCDLAFQYWQKARQGSEHSPSQVDKRLYKNIRKFFTPSLLHTARTHGNASEKPLFIVGMPRSGTTLTEQILSSHTSISGVGELEFMNQGKRQYCEFYSHGKSEQQILANASAGELKSLAAEYLKILDSIVTKPNRYVVDKSPIQFEALGYIHMCFPNAKFIHCQRHPADSFISSYQNALSQFHSYAYSQDGYAEAYLAKEAIMAHWRTIFPKQIFELRYEDLVEDPQGVVSRLLKFLGLEFEEQCLRFFETDRAVRTISKSQVRQAVYTTSRERWRNYEKHLGPLFDALKKASFDYQKTSV